MRIRRDAVLLAMAGVMALASPPFAAPVDAPGVQLPQGESVLALAWLDSGNLVVLTEHLEGYALRRLELDTGEFLVLRVPRSFLNVKLGAEGGASPHFLLSPTGRSLAVLERVHDPLRRPELSVYHLQSDVLVAASTRGLPPDFWPEHAAWDETGEALYLSARPYLFPDQHYSIGRLDVATGDFRGVALKANVDLITEQFYVPRRGALAVRCRSFRGEYPSASMLVLVEGDGGGMTVLHSRADDLLMRALANGQVVVCTDSALSDAAHAGASAGQNASEEWILDSGASRLRRVAFSLEGVASTLAATADGRWIGFLVQPAALGVAGGGAIEYLGLQRVADGRTLLAAQPCASFAFSTNGQHVCAVRPDGGTLYFYRLPRR